MFESLQPGTSSCSGEDIELSDNESVASCASSDEWTPEVADDSSSDDAMDPDHSDEDEASTSVSTVDFNGTRENVLEDSMNRVEMTEKDKSVWYYDEPNNGKTPSKNIVKEGRSIQVPNTLSPEDSFELFLCDDILKIIVECTNKEGRRVFSNKKNEWIDTDVVEIKALIATVLSLGSLNQNMMDLKLVFSEVWGSGFVRSLFGYNRLVTLLACLRFDDKETRTSRKEKDPLAPIRDVWDLFERSLKRHYSPGHFLTIDEQLVPFRGRCKFRMYIPSKPDKYGLKIYWLCDSETGYPLRGLPYVGKVGRLPEKDHGENCVKKTH